MNCWYCGSQLDWQNDFDAKDYFGDESKEGIVTTLLCSNEDCGAFFEGSIIDQEEGSDEK